MGSSAQAHAGAFLRAGRKQKQLIFPALLAISLCLHLFSAFFLLDLSSDEGNWLVNAKNLVLFHTQSLDGVYFTALSPLNTFLHSAIFSVFPISIMTGRWVSILFSFGALAVFYVFLERLVSFRAAVAACLIVGVNSLFVQVTSQALLEAKVCFFALMAVLCVFSDRRDVRIASCLPFALCLGFKPNAVYLAAPLAASIARRRKADIVPFLCGTALFCAAAFLPAYLLDPAAFRHWGLEMHLSGRFDLLRVLRDPLGQGILPSLYYIARRTPLAVIAGFWGVWSALRRQRSQAEDFLLLWAASGIAFYAFQPYVPERYLLDLLFPLAGLFGASTVRLKKFHVVALCGLIAVTQIAVVLWQPLHKDTGRPRLQAAKWLECNAHVYATVSCPAMLGIGYKGRTEQKSLLELVHSKETGFPLLFIDDHDYAAEEHHGFQVGRIGNLRIYSFHN